VNSYLAVVVEILVLACIVAVAAALAAPIRRRTDPDRAGPGGLVHHLVRPAFVLLISLPAAWLVQRWPAAEARIPELSAHLAAWEVFWLGVLALALIEAVVRQVVALRGREWPVPDLLEDILRALLWLALAFLVLKVELGWDIGPLLASTALVTAVLGFALQGVLGNLLAGMSMHLTRTVKQGDWVDVGGIEGRVQRTNWRETRIHTIDGKELIVPNSTVADAVVHNMAHPTPQRRHEVNVGASYSDAPDEVIDALVEAAAAVDEVLERPAPEAVVTAFEDYGINYQLRYWTRQYHRRTWIDGQVSRHVWYQFKRRGIEIPFPMSDKLLNDFMAVVYQQRRLDPTPAALAATVRDLMASELHTGILDARLDRSQWEVVAPLVRRESYTHGETLMRQGEEGDTFHVLVRGGLEGRIDTGVTFAVKPGAVVGEMSLLTGEPRAATLTTATSCELLTFDREAFVALLGLDEAIPERLADLAAARAAENRAAAARVEQERGKATIDGDERRGILRRLLDLLGR
jgi:small-conductance mechanosensitive channel/CRP-like cAMP-binding protein